MEQLENLLSTTLCSANVLEILPIVTGKDRKVWWNEKFTFKLSSSEWKDMSKLKLRIMEKDKFHKDCSVGKAT